MRRRRRKLLTLFRVMRFFAIALLLLAGPAMALFAADIFKEPYADSLHFHRKSFSDDWFPLVHFTSNAIFSWRIDPLLELILNSFGEPYFFAFGDLLFVVGSFLFCLALNKNHRPFLSAFSIAVAGVALVLLFGYDAYVMGAVVWFPWVLYLLYLLLAKRQANSVTFIFLAFFVVRLAESANQLSLLLAIIAFATAYFLSEDRKRYIAWPSFVIAAGITLVEVLRIPAVPLPLYPAFSRVVEERVPLLQGGDAYLGPIAPFSMTTLQIIDVAFLRTFLEPTCFTLLFLSVVAALDAWQRKRSDLERRGVFCWAALMLSAACVLDNNFIVNEVNLIPPFVSQIAPLYTLRRLFPGLDFFPLIYPAIALSVFYLAVLLRAARGYDLLAMIALLLIAPLQYHEWRISPITQREDGSRPWRNLASKGLSSDVRAWRTEVLMSPSYTLVRENEPDFFERVPRVNRNIELTPISRYSFTVNASENTELLESVLRSKGGRWSPGSGRQRGGEWIHVRFDEPLVVKAVKLDVEKFPTDYPRGLEVLYAPECGGVPAAFDGYSLAFKRPKWAGEVAYSDSGYPYREPESNVLAVFNEAVSIKCLLVRQTGETTHYEWSVTGIRLGQ